MSLSLPVIECFLGPTTEVQFRLRVRDLVPAPHNWASVCPSVGEESNLRPLCGPQGPGLIRQVMSLTRLLVGKGVTHLGGCINLAGLAGTAEHSIFGGALHGPRALEE